ncbi:hypothetical protein CMV_002609 [Castanea mollissima]|uniref:Uncharacterized protein n=1 Tax=Castanea mollissima TaxID=60419 RepID=A0A8J4S1R1_9ROSI|nr:hypothetical protein CMV_002609 [Castanea mollissima]
MCFWKRHQGFSAPTENMFHKLIGGGGVQLSFLCCSIAAAVSFAIEILYSWCLVAEFQLCRDAATIQDAIWITVDP